MEYTVKIENLPAKEFLAIKGFVELGGNTPDAYAEQERMLSERINDGSIKRLQKASGSQTIFTLFCNTCELNEQTGGYICGNDIACENANHVLGGDGFEVIHLNPSKYAVFDCSFTHGVALAEANKKIDDVYWGEWLPGNPYESMIETGTGANTQGIACMVTIEPNADDADHAEHYHIKIWFPIRRKQNYT